LATSLIVYVVIAIFTIILINKSVASSVLIMAEPEKLFDWDPVITDKSFVHANASVENWTNARGFKHKHHFYYQEKQNSQPIKCAAWWSETTNTWCMLYVVNGKRLVEFVTLFENDTSLTTGASRDGYLLPKIDTAYEQMFPNLKISDLHAKHQKARAFIEINKGAIVDTSEQNLKKVLPEKIAKQSNYVRTLPHWKLRGAYWFFIRRNIQSNKRLFAEKTSAAELVA